MPKYDKSIRHVILCIRMKQQLIRSRPTILSRERITEAKPYIQKYSHKKRTKKHYEQYRAMI